MKLTRIFIYLLVILSFASFLLYPYLPQSMANHWSSNGVINGYMPKIWALAMIPLSSLLILILYIFIPVIDPLKSNIREFRSVFDSFVLFIMLFFDYIFALTIIYNLGANLDMSLMITPAVGLLFIFSGLLLRSAKRNWFIGIKTPWTLSSDKVWDKTHSLGSKLFIVAGLISFIGLLLPDFVVFFIVVPVVLFTVWLIIYSYIEYVKLQNHK